jgi:aromatic ring-opening dioxygenase catalytic subunit (LigB family)
MLSSMAPATQRLPVVFLPHGGGPWPFVRVGFGSDAEQGALAAYLRGVHDLPKTPPKALLVVSAHWEEAKPTVMNGQRPPLLFDYHGFPPESYELSWPAPGEPALAALVQGLLAAAGIPSASNAERGFDHGTFVPLKLAYPGAEIPTVQLSLKAGLDPSEHLAIGRALTPLRDEGVFIIGSGMTYHNMRAMGPQGRPAASAFDAWLRDAVTRAPSERDALLAAWTDAPAARASHPREEHLLPLMVIAGAAGDDAGRVDYRGTLLGLEFSGYAFG